ncbi:hypothetical protein Cni_G07187 [Canna indica]|uniref:Phytosulfokine n=1 Tax=Canna indica TaxID=4628 RepID=A0AAQ3Q4P2_9LILI|nr:hypothetical protein Cni_G07187 [Canna indica]
MMSKHAPSLLLALLLLSFLSQAARPEPADTTLEQQQVVGEAEFDQTMDGECRGEGEEDCLMRRTLNAHVDYIYTQEKKP